MSLSILIPTPLRPFTGRRNTIELKAVTVGEALSALTAEYADLRQHLYTEDGRIRSFVNIYVNDEDVRYLAKENTPVKDGDTISIVPSIAGGCPSRDRFQEYNSRTSLVTCSDEESSAVIARISAESSR
jgi:adenylyltransferase/sulfurtransferase